MGVGSLSAPIRTAAAVLFGALLAALACRASAEGYQALNVAADSSGRHAEDLGAAWLVPFGPAPAERPAGRPWQSDAHEGLTSYGQRRCESCHAARADNLHSQRAYLTCRQCHGAEPVAHVNHYFSALNPIRRHAYVCAKCHEGANASFATYVIHPPAAARTLETRASFPALYWIDWFMTALIVGVLLVFLPHGIAWWAREWFVKRKREDGS